MTRYVALTAYRLSAEEQAGYLEWCRQEGLGEGAMKLAMLYPPGTVLDPVGGGARLYVVGFSETPHLLVSKVNPGDDYARAVAEREELCPTLVY